MLESITTETAIQAAVVFIVFYLIGFVIAKIFKRASKHRDINASEIFRLLSNSQRILLLIIGSVIAISKLGFNVSAIITGLGLTGFALGLALKDTISNLVAGIIIVLYRPFGIDSKIDILGICGIVTDINLRYITIKTDDDICLVPNSLFLNKTLKLKE